MDQPVKVANPAGGHLTGKKMNTSVSAFAPEKLISRDGFGSPVPRQPAHLITQAESGACFYGIPPEFRGGVHLFILYGRKPSGQSRVYRVTQLRTDGVDCRVSAGTELNLKSSSERVLPWQVTMDPFICAFFPTFTNGMKWAC